ncbi:hypothetical protein BDB01DRAFT_848986 [Pilobolus umbonatus]|nr:hypothetical protein BDB01DRAFT_848986 [Pilobolus umbonatus]
MLHTWLLNENEVWIHSNDLLCNKSQSSTKTTSALLSTLSTSFKDIVTYDNLTEEEALDTIGYFLYEHNDQIHAQLLDSLVKNNLIKPAPNPRKLVINKQISVRGVFTPLTQCYSPLCHPNNVTCYSALCPNRSTSGPLRLVQSDNDDCNVQLPKDWIRSIPAYIIESTSKKELKRQAGIAELLLTEQNYCHDLDILHQVYAIPLLKSDDIITDPIRRKRFYQNVFGNYLDITRKHRLFYNTLITHRETSFFIGRIGPVVMQHVSSLIEPYIQYISNHVKALYCITLEKQINPQFTLFLDTQNADKSTRRLGLQHYLTRPTLWLGRLKLLVNAILKNTEEDSDQLALETALAILHDTLCRMNNSAYVDHKALRLEELLSSIYVPTNHSSDLKLLTIPEDSSLIQEDTVYLARSTHPLQPSLCHVFLFSHSLVLTHSRIQNNKTEYLIIPGSLIPLQMLVIDTSTTTSLIRRLSFASTSMVSTPYHLINSLRRQKAEETNTNAISANIPSLSSSSSSANSTPPNYKPRLFLSNQIRARFMRLKNSFRKKFTQSAPTSPTLQTPVSSSTVRRESAPAMLISHSSTVKVSRKKSLVNRSKTTLTKAGSYQQRRATIKLNHMAYPENAFQLQFNSIASRERWEIILRETRANRFREVPPLFEMKPISRSLTLPIHTAFNFLPTEESIDTKPTTVYGRIRCAYAFAYKTKDLIVLGTQWGVWIGPQDGTETFRFALPVYDVRKLAVLDDKLIMLGQYEYPTDLIAYDLESIIHSPSQTMKLPSSSPVIPSDNLCMIKREIVICFTVGTLLNRSVVVYITRKAQKISLVLVVPKEFSDPSLRLQEHWFQKYKTEYDLGLKDADDVQIIDGVIVVRSEKYGVESIDQMMLAQPIDSPDDLNKPIQSFSMASPISDLVSFNDPTTGSVKTAISSPNQAYLMLLDQKRIYSAEESVKFQSCVSNIRIVHPYIIGFSPSFIEIRHLETGELMQMIDGYRIQYLSSVDTSSSPQPLFFSMKESSNSKTTFVYRLQLT